MKKVRLRDGVIYKKMSTPYGVVTHDWTEVPDNAYVYREMEVFGEKPVSKPVAEKAVEPVKAVKKKSQRKRKASLRN